MDNLFLPREVGSIETGPQTFAGTNVLDTTFYFTQFPSSSSSSPQQSFSSVLVSNAGEININGTYEFVTFLDDKPYYTKGGEGRFFIIYLEGQWNIYDFNISVDPIYFSSENVTYPWLVNTWISISTIYLPLPIVTEIQ